jgi:hypothetical protein
MTQIGEITYPGLQDRLERDLEEETLELYCNLVERGGSAADLKPERSKLHKIEYQKKKKIT